MTFLLLPEDTGLFVVFNAIFAAQRGPSEFEALNFSGMAFVLQSQFLQPSFQVLLEQVFNPELLCHILPRCCKANI